MDEKLKKIRDKNRFHKYGGMELVKELILKLPEKKRYKKGHILDIALLIAKEKIKRRKTKQKFFLAETIVRYAIGNGYLYYEERQNSKSTKYLLLTRKSRKLREQEKQKNSTSEAQNSPLDGFVPAET